MASDTKIDHFCPKIGGNLWTSHQFSNTLETYLCAAAFGHNKYIRVAFVVCVVGGFVAFRTYIIIIPHILVVSAYHGDLKNETNLKQV